MRRGIVLLIGYSFGDIALTKKEAPPKEVADMKIRIWMLELAKIDKSEELK